MEYVIVGIIILSALASIWEKVKEARRQQLEQDEHARKPGDPLTRPAGEMPRNIQEWQEEFKRILQQPRQPQSPPVQLPPPVVGRTLIPTTLVTEEDEEEEGRVPKVLAQATAAYSKGASLQQLIEERLAKVSEQTSHHRPAPLTSALHLPNKAIARDITKNPDSLRRAVLASIILGPPRATEL